MVENETTLNFIHKINTMNPTLLEIIQTHGNRTESTCYCELTPSLVPTGKAELKEGFFFLLVTNGTAQLADEYQAYELLPAHLVILTPSTRCMLQTMSSHFQAMLLYLKPTFFDSLPDGQPLYEQLAHYLGHYQLPVFLLENEQATYLQKSSLYLHHAEIMQPTITTVF